MEGKFGRDVDDAIDFGLLSDFTTLDFRRSISLEGEGGTPYSQRRHVDEGGTPDDANRLNEIFVITPRDWEMKFHG